MLNINPGVDFRGGTLIKLTLDQPIDSNSLRLNLEKEGLIATVNSYPVSNSYIAEIELGQSQDLIKAEELKDNFTKILNEQILIESSSNVSSNGTLSAGTQRQTLDQLANQMFVLSKTDKKANEIANLNLLNKEFSIAYTKVYDNYQKSISTPIQKYVKYTSISIHTVSPVLKGKFIEKAEQAVFYSAIVSIIFVFFFFRTFVPSLAVVLGAASDVIIALGGMGLFGIPFTLPTLAALLMLMGFSLDTDILLTMRMLRREGDPRDKAFDAFKTGTTMSLAAIFAFLVLFLISLYTHISTYYEISAVALFGLVGDLFATWGINAILLLNHVESKQKSGQNGRN
ncbi:hypothetical protein HZC07_02955 [Candidatus Micrarchaeota archaeon]|nr:hypothetical protein [Candidatus Micrarchaeota archaeon]